MILFCLLNSIHIFFAFETPIASRKHRPDPHVWARALAAKDLLSLTPGDIINQLRSLLIIIVVLFGAPPPPPTAFYLSINLHLAHFHLLSVLIYVLLSFRLPLNSLYRSFLFCLVFVLSPIPPRRLDPHSAVGYVL